MARGADPRRRAGGRDRRRHQQRHAPHGLVRVLGRAGQPAARERGVGHARQLRLPADGLPAARRAPRLDRRHPGLRPDGELPVRQRRVPRLVAARRRRRAGRARRRLPDSGADGAALRDEACRRLGRRRDRRADHPAGAVRRPARPAEQYPSMRAWADALLAVAGERLLWEGMFQFGDWLDPDAPPDDPAGAKADPDIVASAYLVRSLAARHRRGARARRRRGCRAVRRPRGARPGRRG